MWILNGFTRNIAWNGGSYDDFGVDPSGQYYFATVAADRTLVAAIQQPDVTLYESRLRCKKLFVQDRRLYLFGGSTDYTTTDNQEIPVEIVSQRSKGWALERALSLKRGVSGPAPFYVEDMDPSFERVLVVDQRDLPFAGKLYLHDLASGTRVRVKGDVHPWILFLKRDLLRQPLAASPGGTG